MIAPGTDNDLGLYHGRTPRRCGRVRALAWLPVGLFAMSVLAVAVICGALGYGRDLFE